MITAWVSDADEASYITITTSTGHQIQFGGRDGDGYCYGHQSFDCLDNLTAEEKAAVNAA